jgi:hypothetical protein
MKLLFGILVLLPLLLKGQQNLVPNGGFDESAMCPWTIGQLELATGWINSGGGGTPDMFSECATQSVGVPVNTVGNQHGHSSPAYAGFYAVSDIVTYPNMREYPQTELIAPLQASTTYEVIFHLSLAERSKYAISGIGVHFSDTIIERENGLVLNLEPQIQSPEWIILNDKVNWMEVRDTFYSRFGGERWMIIGNFQLDSLSQLTYTDSVSNSLNRSYYYIDDVSVVALGDTVSSIMEMGYLQFSVYPNPATEVVQVKGIGLAKARLLDISGREVMRSFLLTTTEVNISHLPLGLYLLEVIDREGRKAVQKLVVE